MEDFLKKKDDARYDLVAPTSMGLRLAPGLRQQLSRSHHLTMQATSAESNVLSVSASLGLNTEVLTAFVKGSPISSFIKSELSGRHIGYEGPEREQGGPWGYRHQINFTESGFGVRGAQVCNDRAGEVGRTLSVDDFDLDRLFGRDGVRILHLSGLIAALSPETGEFCLELVKTAKKYGTRVSFDMNYRASFWKGREKELGGIFRKLAAEADVLMNFQLMDEDGIPQSSALDPEKLSAGIRNLRTFCWMTSSGRRLAKRSAASEESSRRQFFWASRCRRFRQRYPTMTPFGAAFSLQT